MDSSLSLPHFFGAEYYRPLDLFCHDLGHEIITQYSPPNSRWFCFEYALSESRFTTLSVRHVQVNVEVLMRSSLNICERNYWVFFVASPVIVSWSTRNADMHPTLEVNISKWFFHNGKSSNFPLNLGTDCFRLPNSREPTSGLWLFGGTTPP